MRMTIFILLGVALMLPLLAIPASGADNVNLAVAVYRQRHQEQIAIDDARMIVPALRMKPRVRSHIMVQMLRTLGTR